MDHHPSDEEFTRPPVIVRIPFASPTLLWKTKQTFRGKDEIDRVFLRRLLIDRGEWPVD